MSGITMYFVEVIYKDGEVDELGRQEWGYTKLKAKRIAREFNRKEEVALARVKTEYMMA